MIKFSRTFAAIAALFLAYARPAAAVTDSTSNVTASRSPAADWNTAANWNLTSDTTQHVVPDAVDATARLTSIQTDLRLIQFSQTNTTIGHLYIDNSVNNGTSTANSKANQIAILNDNTRT